MYLNVFLRATGDDPQQVRALFHDLGERANSAVERGLILRKLTLAHLVRITENRDCLVSRYGPKMSDTLSQNTRLMATLNEIAR